MKKPEINQQKKNKVFQRITKPKPIINKEDKIIFTSELNNNSWSKFTLFLEHHLRDFIPRNYENREHFAHLATIQRKCLKLLEMNHNNNWQNLLEISNKDNWLKLLEEIPKIEYNQGEIFCFHLSRKYEYNPQEFLLLWDKNIKEFTSLFSDIVSSENPDLMKLENFANIIDSFNRFPERTFFLLYQLPNYLEENDKEILINCQSYQTIIKFGASEFIGKFGYTLQKEFNITRTAIKEKAAQNLVQELGETEATLQAEINRLEEDKKELKKQLQYLQDNSLQDALYQLAKSLQNEQQQPVLDQLFNLYKKIDKLLENNESLSPQDTLTCFINLENFFKALSSLNIQPFPPNTETILEITGEDLDNNKYNYISGSQFTTKEEVKKVKCITCGWQVGEEIITPAKVAEITESPS
ncbi:MAG: nucleotide exchange factor GrpE [Cyanobacterium sp. T60_A2020_053]|nr:nucleotide exchange factor GrpE [Cyanobacterium sp. T60_A2020_053]